MNKEERKNLAKKQLEVLNEIEQNMTMGHVIKNNTIEFKSGEKQYRVRKPNFVERQNILDFQRKMYLELIKDDTMLFRKQWVDLYQKKGIDIAKMEAEMKNMQAEIEALLLKLVKIEDIKVIGNIRKDIIDLRRKMWDINVERTDLLQHSIEDQLLLRVNSYTTYLVLEVKDKNTWKKHFENYNDFQNCIDDDLMTKTFNYISSLIYGGFDESTNSEKSS